MKLKQQQCNNIARLRKAFTLIPLYIIKFSYQVVYDHLQISQYKLINLNIKNKKISESLFSSFLPSVRFSHTPLPPFPHVKASEKIYGGEMG